MTSHRWRSTLLLKAMMSSNKVIKMLSIVKSPSLKPFILTGLHHLLSQENSLLLTYIHSKAHWKPEWEVKAYLTVSKETKHNWTKTVTWLFFFFFLAHLESSIPCLMGAFCLLLSPPTSLWLQIQPPCLFMLSSNQVFSAGFNPKSPLSQMLFVNLRVLALQLISFSITSTYSSITFAQ